MSYPFLNPISPIQLGGTQTVPRDNTYGVTYSINNIGGYMEVFSLSDLIYTIPTGTTGTIEYSGNTIPIEFLKGTGTLFSPDVLTLGSDNISSGRRRLGMLVYVYEKDQVYQYSIDDYFNLWSAATGSTGTVVISDFGTTVNNSSPQGQNFINAWTGNTIEGVNGVTRKDARWRKYYRTQHVVNNLSTGLYYFTGITITSPTTFSVSPVKGWIVDNELDTINPTITYVEYSGQTGLTTPYLTTNTITYVSLTSGGTITLSTTAPTTQQQRQNIYLGKLGHANKTSLIQAFNEPDYVQSPLSQLRDMFFPIRLINSGVYPSTNGVNLNFNTSSGNLFGLGINYTNNLYSPNDLSVSGQSPTTFQYRTQTGGTTSNVTLIDPTNYDNGGVITTVGGGTNNSTNQRIFLTQNGTIRVQYGQQIYSDLPTAIAAANTESFITFSNFRDNAILIGILSVRHTATDLSNTTQARFLLASKFGETIGSSGGISTTTLQQAYDNSSNPEIVINSTLDGVSFKNGTGNADNSTQLIQGLNTAGDVTSFIRADGLISGFTFTTPGFIANSDGVTGNTISATTYQNLPNLSSTVYVFNMNSYAIPNSSLFYGVYLGGTPVTPPTVTNQYGSASTTFMPGYPMPAGSASTLVVILRAAQSAPTSPVYVKIANNDTSTFGPVVTIPAGSAAGTYTDNSATVSFTTNQRLFVIASNPFVAGATASGTLTTGSFKYTLS